MQISGVLNMWSKYFSHKMGMLIEYIHTGGNFGNNLTFTQVSKHVYQGQVKKNKEEKR